MAEDKFLKTIKTRSSRMIIFFTMLIIVGLACNAPSMRPQTSDKPAGFVETSVAKTMSALEEKQPPDVSDQDVEEPEIATQTLTSTPENTPKPSLTPTNTDTPTPQVAMIYASQNTNCRTGQGTEWQWLVTLLAGEEAEAVGIDNTGEYWYIRRPDQPSTFCWLWGKYATPSGPYQSLPVYTQIPTPTPGMEFSLEFYSLETCGGQWGLVYQVVNTGAITLESYQTTAVDHTGGSAPLGYDSDMFSEFSGCMPVNQQEDLTAGEGQHVLMTFDNDPTGHDITTRVEICAENGLGGECVTRSIRHTP